MKNQTPTVRSTRTRQSNFMLPAAADKTDAKYVNDFTETIRAIAAQLGDTELLNKLSNDLRSSERLPCGVQTKIQQQNFKQS